MPNTQDQQPTQIPTQFPFPQQTTDTPYLTDEMVRIIALEKSMEGFYNLLRGKVANPEFAKELLKQLAPTLEKSLLQDITKHNQDPKAHDNRFSTVIANIKTMTDTIDAQTKTIKKLEDKIKNISLTPPVKPHTGDTGGIPYMPNVSYGQIGAVITSYNSDPEFSWARIDGLGNVLYQPHEDVVGVVIKDYNTDVGHSWERIDGQGNIVPDTEKNFHPYYWPYQDIIGVVITDYNSAPADSWQRIDAFYNDINDDRYYYGPNYPYYEGEASSIGVMITSYNSAPADSWQRIDGLFNKVDDNGQHYYYSNGKYYPYYPYWPYYGGYDGYEPIGVVITSYNSAPADSWQRVDENYNDISNLSSYYGRNPYYYPYYNDPNNPNDDYPYPYYPYPYYNDPNNNNGNNPYPYYPYPYYTDPNGKHDGSPYPYPYGTPYPFSKPINQT